MIIVDDRLSIEALARRPVPTSMPDETVATTWGFHFRLLRALADARLTGSLSRATSADVRAAAVEPPPATLVVLDPRRSTAMAATVAAAHGLNLLAAELLAAAKVHDARVVVAAGNLGRHWSTAFAAEHVDLQAVSL